MEKKCLSISEQYNEVASASQWQKGQKRKCYFIWKAFEMMIKSWWFSKLLIENTIGHIFLHLLIVSWEQKYFHI